MCFSTAASPSSAVSQVRTVRALSMVSTVVKVLDTTTTSVSAGSRPLRARATSMGSTLARKRRDRPAAVAADSWSVRRAVCTKSGPRKEPPMPMATTFVSGLPVAPTHSPERTRSVNASILSRTSHTLGTTFPSPGALMTASRGARVATCRTARSSVLLMASPANMASILARRPARSARARSRPCVLGVMRWRAMSSRMPSDSWNRASHRASSRRRSFRWLEGREIEGEERVRGVGCGVECFRPGPWGKAPRLSLSLSPSFHLLTLTRSRPHGRPGPSTRVCPRWWRTPCRRRPERRRERGG